MKNRTTFWLALLTTAIAPVTLCVPVRAETPPGFRFNIPAQGLAGSLTMLGRETGTEIVFSPAIVGSRQASALVGAYSFDGALQHLLIGTGLRARHLSNGAYVVEVSARTNPMYLTAADTRQAQTADVGTPAPAASQTEPSEIVVTGSRVITNGNNSPTPVTVATTQQLLEAQPAGLVEGLNSLPGLLGSINSTSSVNTGGYNTINLRGLGTTRALILYDGRRVGPTHTSGAGAGGADVDVIPQILLKRVDVVTGGASAVYGSDAVSGVVNFITDTTFEGLKLNAQNGISRYGDDRKTALGAAFGHKLFDGRGHVEFGVEYKDSAGIESRTDRPFFDTIYSEEGSVVGGGTVGSIANPYVLTEDARLSTATFGGLINNGPLAGLNFTQNGVPSVFNHGTATGTSGVEVGGDGAYYTGSSVSPSQRLIRGFGRFDYDVTDDIHAYVQFSGTHFRQIYTEQNLYLNKVSIGYNNAFLSDLPGQYQSIIQDQLSSAGEDTLPSFQFSKMDSNIPDYRYVADENYYMGAVGLNGEVGKFHWNVEYYRTSSTEKLRNNNVNAGRLYAALNAVTDSSGNIVCNAAVANPSAYGNCVPLNMFGPTSESDSAISYIEQITHSAQHYKQDDVNATLTGDVFKLPAGPVKLALNGEYRTLTYSATSDALSTDAVDCAGIQFNCSADTTPYLGGSVVSRSPVTQTVAEGAIETNIPILANTTLVKSLDVNAAARYAHYNRSGGVWTWKVGAVWKVNDDITLRATRSRDIRAPNLTELLAPASYQLKNYVDPHTGASGQVSLLSVGNPDLTPEKADTVTAGLVVKPSFVPGFSLAVDYYRIRVKDAILVVGGFSPGTGATCEASNGTSPLCDLYVRPYPFSDRSPDNFPTLLLQQTENVAALKTHGIDIEANYHTRLFDRALDLRALTSWQPHLIYNNGPTGTVDLGGAADGGTGGIPPIPAIKVVASAGYDITDSIRLFAQERWRGKLRQNGNDTIYFVDGKIPSVGYTDMTLTFSPKGTPFTTFINIQNLFDKKPFPVASAGGSVQMNYLGGYAQGDDIEGRYFTFGVRLNL